MRSSRKGSISASFRDRRCECEVLVFKNLKIYLLSRSTPA